MSRDKDGTFTNYTTAQGFCSNYMRDIYQDSDAKCFGYLRRNPNAMPDTDLSGYHFWLNKSSAVSGNYLTSEMVRAFITSSEYRARFGP